MKPLKRLPRYDASDRVMQLAGAWLARQDRGLTAAESAEFRIWIQADASHAAAVAQLERTMSTFERLRELEPHTAEKPDCDAFAPPSRASRRWLTVASLGVAAAIATMVWSGRTGSTPATWHYATAESGFEHATLVDGSRVKLNANTSVDIEFTARERRVHLSRGEAHFEVAKDSVRPFVVRANRVSVSAVGTAFNVRLATAGVEVLVTEGKVRVEPAQASGTTRASEGAAPEIPLLTAGHKVVVPAAILTESPEIAAISPEEMHRALAWHTRVVEFRKTPLKEIVAEFNRLNLQQIVIADADLETLRVGGSFRTDQPEAFVRLLENSFGVAAERSGDVLTLRKAATE